MRPVTVETRWLPAETAQGREIAYHAEMGFHWFQVVGRHSWMLLGLVCIAGLAGLYPLLAETLAEPGLLETRGGILVAYGSLLWGAWEFVTSAVRWLRNGFRTHWPAQGGSAMPVTIRVDGRGIAQRSAGVEAAIAWGGITRIVEAPDRFVITSGSNLVAMLPKTPDIRMLLEAASNGPAATDRIASLR